MEYEEKLGKISQLNSQYYASQAVLANEKGLVLWPKNEKELRLITAEELENRCSGPKKYRGERSFQEYCEGEKLRQRMEQLPNTHVIDCRE